MAAGISGASNLELRFHWFLRISYSSVLKMIRGQWDKGGTLTLKYSYKVTSNISVKKKLNKILQKLKNKLHITIYHNEIK